MPIDPLVLELLEAVQSGRSPEDVCADRPELLGEIRERLGRLAGLLDDLDALFPEPGATGPWETPASRPTGLPEIPGHVIESVLGRGGMGVVYKALHLALNRPVAVKMMLAGGYAGPPELARFYREAEALAALVHPNVVQVHEVGDLNGLPYFTMEYVEGGSLAMKLAGAPLSSREAAALAATLAEAVEAAHRSGIVHRDLKPANVLLTADSIPKIGDFGLARRLDGGAGATRTGTALGTPSYMAPEQARGEPCAAEPPADIYGLGAMLYELLTGRPPFRAETGEETVRQVLSEDPVPPSRLNGKVPRDLETVCLKCLHKEPRHRYQAAAVLAQDLRRFLRGEAVTARPLGLFHRCARRIRRQPALAAAVALVTVLTVSLIGAGMWMLSERAAAERGVQATERAADDDLEEMAQWLKKSSWPEARAAMERAKGRLNTINSHSVELRRRLERGRRDLDLVSDLEEIRLLLSSGGDGHGYSPETLYAEAFRKDGIDIVALEPAEASARIRNSAIRETLVAFLHDWLYWISEGDRARVQAVVDLADDDRWRRAFRELMPVRERETGKIKALALEPEAAGQPTVILSGLGGALLGSNQREAALTLLNEAQQRHPADFWINYLLGHFWDRERPQRAVGYFRAALAIRPGSDQAYSLLAKALRDSGDTDGAIAAFRKKIALNPDRDSIGDLAKLLAPRGRLEEVRVIWGEFLNRNPPEYAPWYGYAQLCLFLGHEGVYRQTCKALLDRFGNSDDWVIAERTSLACLLLPASGDELQRAVDLADRAVAAGEKAAGPGSPYLGFLKGLAEHRLGRPERAIPLLRESAPRLPDRAGPSLVLAMALSRSGYAKEARKTLAAAIRDYRWDKSWADHTSGWVSHVLRREAERIILPKLRAFLDGTRQPRDNDERLALLGVCQFEGRWSTAARLYAEAFEADPKLAEDPYAQGHYTAACFASLAGSGRGDDETAAVDPDRARWRRQARDWLRADLSAMEKLLDSNAPVSRQHLQGNLEKWTADPTLAGLRDPAELKKLSPAERQECRNLWRDHDALLERAVTLK